MTIITSFWNPIVNTDNYRGIEITGVRDILIKSGYETFVAGTKCRTNKDCDYYLDLNNIDYSKVENIIINLTPPNFFGGQMNMNCRKFVEKIALQKYKNIFFLATDPRIKPFNFAKELYDRFNICEDLIQDWDYIIKNATYIFDGKDINKFWNDDIQRETINVNLYNFLSSKKDISDFISIEDKKWRCIYYGDKRGSYREKQLRKYITNEDLLVGYKSDKIDCQQNKKAKNSELNSIINQSRTVLIIGDKEHENNLITLRLFESMATSSLVVIDKSYDPNMDIIQDPVLRKIVYIDSKDDIDRAADLYCKSLIDLQHQELERLLTYKNVKL